MLCYADVIWLSESFDWNDINQNLNLNDSSHDMYDINNENNNEIE